MFNRNTLEGILSSFTKVADRLDSFAQAEEAKADVLKDELRDATANATKARKVLAKINDLVSA